MMTELITPFHLGIAMHPTIDGTNCVLLTHDKGVAMRVN